jgi:hypothetical protein
MHPLEIKTYDVYEGTKIFYYGVHHSSCVYLISMLTIAVLPEKLVKIHINDKLNFYNAYTFII